MGDDATAKYVCGNRRVERSKANNVFVPLFCPHHPESTSSIPTVITITITILSATMTSISRIPSIPSPHDDVHTESSDTQRATEIDLSTILQTTGPVPSVFALRVRQDDPSPDPYTIFLTPTHLLTTPRYRLCAFLVLALTSNRTSSTCISTFTDCLLPLPRWMRADLGCCTGSCTPWTYWVWQSTNHLRTSMHVFSTRQSGLSTCCC